MGTNKHSKGLQTSTRSLQYYIFSNLEIPYVVDILAQFMTTPIQHANLFFWSTSHMTWEWFCDELLESTFCEFCETREEEKKKIKERESRRKNSK